MLFDCHIKISNTMTLCDVNVKFKKKIHFFSDGDSNVPPSAHSNFSEFDYFVIGKRKHLDAYIRKYTIICLTPNISQRLLHQLNMSKYRFLYLLLSFLITFLVNWISICILRYTDSCQVQIRHSLKFFADNGSLSIHLSYTVTFGI